MADPIRIKDIATTATTAAADDYYVLDGATNGTRKLAKANVQVVTAKISDLASGRGPVLTGTQGEAQDALGAGTAGKAAFVATTAAALRTAAGFGGTVTVAQLNAAGDDAKSAMYYCSDCLTVNGPGSLVAWCGRTSTWRTLDDCLLATTDFGAWCDDFVRNTNSSELRGTKGALFCAINSDSLLHLFSASGTGATASVSGDTSGLPLLRKSVTGASTASAYVRDSSTAGAFIYNVVGSSKVFAGVRQCSLDKTSADFTFRFGIASSLPAAALANYEDSLVFDAGNSLGFNAGLSSSWLALSRAGAANQAGTGVIAGGPTANEPFSATVIRDAGAVSVRINGTAYPVGTNNWIATNQVPFCVLANVTTANVTARKLGFCSGYLLP